MSDKVYHTEYLKGFLAALKWIYTLLESDLFDNKRIKDAIERGVKEIEERENK